MIASGFTQGAAAILHDLAETVPFPMWTVSRRSGNDYTVIATRDTQYGLVEGDVLPWSSTLCARSIDGSAPSAAGDIGTVAAWVEAAAELQMDVGAYITVPLVGSGGQLHGTLCGADPERRNGSLEQELAAAHRAAKVLTVLLEQQLRLEQALRLGEQWEQVASRDTLTGVGNRHYWDAMVARVEAQCEQLGGTAVVILLDVDGLKSLNDDLGHAAGDALLRATGDVLRTTLRSGDVVARIGVDGFAVLLVDADEQIGAATVERLRAALDSVDVSVSIGAASRRGGMRLTQAWHLADAAMYADKASRNGEGQPRRGALASAPPAVDTEVHELIREAREALGMPIAFMSRLTGGRRVIEAIDATCPVPFRPGDAHSAQDTYCQRIVDGTLPEAIPDTAANPTTAALPVTVELEIGAYVGVPITLSDGSVYGTLCAYSNEARPVDDRDSAILHLVARTLSHRLSRERVSSAASREIEERLARVLDEDLLRSVYQPIVDISSGESVAVEALSRFPDYFGRRPDQWFADATLVGQAATLELAAIRKAGDALLVLPPHVALSVNVSPAVLLDPQFTEWLATVPADRIMLELTEHEAIADYDALLRALAPARSRGVRIAVDDAGAGYASMRHTLLLKPDLLKLDISLVRDVDADRNKRALCRAIITFAKTVGTRVVAEGVETAGELLALRRLGVDYAQGYHFARPTPLDEVRFGGYLESPTAPAAPEALGEGVEVILREMTLAGASATTIAARLNGLGERSPRGLRWHATSVGDELTRQDQATS